MQLTVQLFAAARVRAGAATWVVELVEPRTVAGLKQALVKACPALEPIISTVRIAVDATYAEDHDPIAPGAEIAVIPPVSGGIDDSRISIAISPALIDHAAITDSVRSNQAGAVCAFLGTVREMTDNKQTSALEYESYFDMAEKILWKLALAAMDRWPIERLAIAHRTGVLELGEISVVVAVSCPHRGESFDACRWLIDTLKQDVPIWKKEVWADGTEEWVHPGSG